MKVIMTKGLPASGKTTFAKELIAKEPGKYKRVNKDDLRSMLDNGKWSRDNEEFILFVRDSLIMFALMHHKSVIVDDTNLHPKHEAQLIKLVEQHNSMLMPGKKELVEFEIKDFTDVTVEECITRDKKRANYVGEKVIKDMYNQFLKPPVSAAPNAPGLPTAILCDLDGTLALFGSKNPYDRDFTQDDINVPVAQILHAFSSVHTIILVSGRKNKFITQTAHWLTNHNIPFKHLYMPRADTDNRKDTVIKDEIYTTHIQNKYNVLFVLDDRLQVCRLWHQLGLTVLRVGDPDADF